jgi:glycosyltransferase involved in cell wall biosynthesis
MKIVIDATTLTINNGGVSSYLRGLLEEFNYSNNQIETLLPPKINIPVKFLAKKAQTLYRELYWQQRILPKAYTKHNGDILFSPSHLITIQKGIKKVVTFHDMYIMRNPKSFRKWHALYSNYIYPKIFESDAYFIAISEFTKMEILNYFPKCSDRIRVVKSAISREFREIVDHSYLDRIKLKYNLPSEFILTVGSLEPRKNIISILKLYDRIESNELPMLVLVSPDGWNNQHEIDIIRRLITKKKMIWLTDIIRDELIALYNLALIFLYPSLYEGFGMPPMEAMACKCPVITSNNSSLTEYYSDSALLLNNPLSIDELGFNLSKILTDRNLSISLIEKGYNNALKYSFSRTAEETFSYFNEIVG